MTAERVPDKAGKTATQATPARPATMPLGELAKRTTVVLSIAVAFAGGLWVFLQVREILLWLVIAAVLAMALEPAVGWLTRHRFKRGLAAVTVSVLAIAVLAGIVAVLAVPLVNQARQLIDNLPNYIHDFTKPGSPFAGIETRFHVVEKIKAQAPHLLSLIAGAGSPALTAVKTTFTVIASIVSILTMTVLLLMEGPRTWKWVLSLVPNERRSAAADLGSHLLTSVGGYVRGNLFISLIAGVTAYIAMLIVGVPYALPLAVAVAVLDLIPLIGATLGAIVCVIVALAGGGWLDAVILAAYFILYQQVENNLIQTTVYARTVALSPLAVLVASLCGAAVAGIVGVLLAIPVAATVVIATVELQALHAGTDATAAAEILESVAEGPDEAPGEAADEAGKDDEREQGGGRENDDAGGGASGSARS
jgi:predicted PurR-regulated permease PerM